VIINLCVYKPHSLRQSFLLRVFVYSSPVCTEVWNHCRRQSAYCSSALGRAAAESTAHALLLRNMFDSITLGALLAPFQSIISCGQQSKKLPIVTISVFIVTLKSRIDFSAINAVLLDYPNFIQVIIRHFICTFRHQLV